MAFLELDDSTAIADITVFPRTWQSCLQDEIDIGKLIKMNVKVEEEEPRFKLIANKIDIYKE